MTLWTTKGHSHYMRKAGTQQLCAELLAISLVFFSDIINSVFYFYHPENGASWIFVVDGQDLVHTADTRFDSD